MESGEGQRYREREEKKYFNPMYGDKNNWNFAAEPSKVGLMIV